VSTATKPKLVELPPPSDEPAVVRARIRGRVYTFTEMEIGEYDKLVVKATRSEADPETGLEEEVIDNVLLMKLMIDKVVDPKPPQEVVHVGTRMYRAFSRIVNELHYGDEPVEILKDDDDEGETPEEKPSGNA
jgi:hypothetical protein